PISVGQSTRNTFSVPLEGLPRQWTLFSPAQDGYVLRFTGAMDGRISDGRSVYTLDARKKSGARRAGDHWVLPLPNQSRGQLFAGEMTLLFQFVTAPRLQARPRLPASVRGSLADRIDPQLAVIMAISVLVHFGIALYAYQYDQTVQTRTDKLHRQFVEEVYE